MDPVTKAVGSITVGLDVGQRFDPTAICVAEAARRPRDNGGSDVHYLIRHLERLPLGTRYPDVAARVAEVVNGIVTRTRRYPRLFVDATGVGTPLVDILKAARVGAAMSAVYFTHGDRRTVENNEIKLGKAWLVSRLQALLQSQRLHLPKSSEAEALAKELLDYEIRVDENANDRYGAFKVGTHDDLVTALGLACQDDGPMLPFSWMHDDPGIPAVTVTPITHEGVYR